MNFKKYTLILACCMLIAPLSLTAFVHPVPEDCKRFAASAEYLYWFPTVDDTFFVIKDAASSFSLVQGPRINSDFDFSSGFRIAGAYGFGCGRELHVRYARLTSSQHKRISGPVLSQIRGGGTSQILFNYNGTATAQLNFLYNNADIVFLQHSLRGCLNKFSVFGGGQYSFLKPRERFIYTAITPTPEQSRVFQENKNNAFGPVLGVELTTPLFCLPVTFKAQASGSLLIDKSNTQFETGVASVPPGYEDLVDHTTWRLLTAWNARFGFSYRTNCCRKMVLEIEAGYELTSYTRALSRMYIPSGFAYTSTNYYNIDLQGLYVSTGVAF